MLQFVRPPREWLDRVDGVYRLVGEDGDGSPSTQCSLGNVYEREVSDG